MEITVLESFTNVLKQQLTKVSDLSSETELRRTRYRALSQAFETLPSDVKENFFDYWGNIQNDFHKDKLPSPKFLQKHRPMCYE